MFKKILVAALAAIGVSSAFAGNLYLGPTFLLQDNTTQTSNYRGFSPRLSIGYADMIEDFNLAAEIFMIPFSATIADNHSNGAVSTRSTRSYGISVLPGMMVTQSVLGFLRLGALSTQFPSPNTSRTGGQVGVGLQTCLTPYWDLRVEYDYTAYKTVPTLGSVKSGQAGIGFIYKVLN